MHTTHYIENPLSEKTRFLGIIVDSGDCREAMIRYECRLNAVAQQTAAMSLRSNSSQNGTAGPMPSEELFKLLVCPMGKVPLTREGECLVCSRCGTRFAISDDIPNMLIEEAELPAGCVL